MEQLQDELGTVNEVADLLGVSRQRVHQLMTEGDDRCPRPIVSKSSGKIQLWDLRDVGRWAKRNRYPRRPRPTD